MMTMLTSISYNIKMTLPLKTEYRLESFHCQRLLTKFCLPQWINYFFFLNKRIHNGLLQLPSAPLLHYKFKMNSIYRTSFHSRLDFHHSKKYRKCRIEIRYINDVLNNRNLISFQIIIGESLAFVNFHCCLFNLCELKKEASNTFAKECILFIKHTRITANINVANILCNPTIQNISINANQILFHVIQ